MDPRLFSPGAVDPETAALNERIEAFATGKRHVTDVSVAEARAARDAGLSVFGPVRLSPIAAERVIPGPGGEIGLRIFPAEDPLGVYLHIHGGGWALGSSRHQDPRLELLSRRCGLTVVSVEYRLAPEHPYPAAPDDCEAAAVWLVEHASSEFGTDRLAIGGESAGAHLAAVTLIRMRDRHGSARFLGANLLYGVFDLRLTPSARNWGDRWLVMDTPTVHWFVGHFLGEGVSAEDPDVSPLLADLSGLPPALFTVGTADMLLDDSLFMYERWVAAGNQAGLAIYPGAPHAFDAFDIPAGHQALARTHRFLQAVLAPEADGVPATPGTGGA